jgi:hypothetical protein
VRTIRLVLLALFVLIAPEVAQAHAFGQRFDLPIPLNLYLWGAAAAVVVSFLLIGFFFRGRSHALPFLNLENRGPLRWLRRQHWIFRLCAALVVAMLVFTIVTAVFGNSDPGRNFAPTFFWIIFWVGLPLLAAIFGNIWEPLNPALTITRWIRGKKTNNASSDQAAAHTAARQHVWFALGFFIVFTWIELVSTLGYKPPILGLLLLIYYALLVFGGIRFGEQWVANADFFSVLSRVIGAGAPLGRQDGKVVLRIPGSGLLELKVVRGMTLFILFLLAGVTYDGLKESQFWNTLIASVGIAEMPSLVSGTLGLLLLFALYTAGFWLALWIMKQLVRPKESISTLSDHFAVSLVPIGIVYSIAHYLTLVLITGQGIIPLLSDPFGTGSDWFGTADYQIYIQLISPKVVWYSQVVLVIVGHIVGVYLAHIIGLRLFAKTGRVIKSQLPMLALMVAFTLFSLWILSAQLFDEVPTDVKRFNFINSPLFWLLIAAVIICTLVFIWIRVVLRDGKQVKK